MIIVNWQTILWEIVIGLLVILQAIKIMVRKEVYSRVNPKDR